MIRLLMWILILLGLSAVVTFVPFNGKTLLDRMLGEATSAKIEEQAKEALPESLRKNPTDRLTDKDRKSLDNLIEKKLKGPTPK